jgi:hypothetical protein
LQNSFASKLGKTGLDVFSLFVVDLMHEYELGVGKSLFLHLLRIVEAHGADKTTGEDLLTRVDTRQRTFLPLCILHANFVQISTSSEFWDCY